jgi:hypothetical protein
MSTPNAECQQMFLSSYFTTIKDWQRNNQVAPSFPKISKLYRTVLDLGLNMTIIYDQLPLDLLSNYSNERWNWEKVALTDYDSKYGVNDVRYFFFTRLLEQHPEWKYVFVMDAFDVVVKMNPCPFLQKGKLYIQSEVYDPQSNQQVTELKGHPWMSERFLELGGKYNDWFKSLVDDKTRILNCGLTGGHRDMLLDLFHNMTDVLSDPELADRKKHKEINVNMAALNYVIYNHFWDKVITGTPLHSVYKMHQDTREDVWFIHKF